MIILGFEIWGLSSCGITTHGDKYPVLYFFVTVSILYILISILLRYVYYRTDKIIFGMPSLTMTFGYCAGAAWIVSHAC